MEKEEKGKVDGSVYILIVGLGVTAVLWYFLKNAPSTDSSTLKLK